jgi:hypothetical protein
MPRIQSRLIEEERVMEMTVERLDDELIDLGAASIETKGPGTGGFDGEARQSLLGGLSDD